MTKRETFQLMTMIAQFYDQFEVDQKKLDSWFEALKEYAFDEIKSNLHSFVTTSLYPPKMADLLGNSATVSRIIPDCEHTHSILSRQRKPASDSVVHEELSKIRELLGIQRDE